MKNNIDLKDLKIKYKRSEKNPLKVTIWLNREVTDKELNYIIKKLKLEDCEEITTISGDEIDSHYDEDFDEYVESEEELILLDDLLFEDD